MTRLTDDEKAQRKRQRKIDKAQEYQIGKYVTKFVAPVFQRMIRAEAGAQPLGLVTAIIEGHAKQFGRRVGECVCVTCGVTGAWSGGLGGMHTGHFLAGRRHAILFDEENVAPQCSRCNRYLDGAPQEFRRWMLEVRGMETVVRLTQLKATIRKFTREELVDMRIEYEARLKSAIERMKTT